MSALLSIVVPVYNTEALLPRCIDSVLAQEYQDWELLLVDDGSTDGSLQVCRDYAQRDARIKVFSQSNTGQSGARNLALSHAQGKYIAFLDSDDSIAPATYTAALEILEAQDDIDLVQYPIYWIAPDKPFRTCTELAPIRKNRSAILDIWIARQIPWFVWDKVYRAGLLDGLEFRRGIVFEDNLLLLQILLRCQGIAFSTVGNYCYQQTEFSEDKWQWTPYKARSQAVVNGEMLLCLLPHMPLFAAVRGTLIERLVDYVYSYVKGSGYGHEVVRISFPYIRRIPLLDLLTSRVGLSWRARVKALWLYLQAYIR